MMQTTQNRRQKGFTLVEIMVVIVIIGLLATFGTIKLRGRLEKAKVDTAATKCAEYERAIDAFVIQNSGSEISADEMWDMMIEEKMIESRGDLKDPWGETYLVIMDEDGEYSVISKGKDRQEETEDDVGRRGLISENNEEDF